MLAYLHTTELAKRRACWLFHSHAFSTTGIAKDFMCFHSEHIRDLSLKNSVFCFFFQLPTNAPGLFTHSVCSSWLSSIVTQNAKRACTCTICTHWASIVLRCIRSYHTFTRVAYTQHRWLDTEVLYTWEEGEMILAPLFQGVHHTSPRYKYLKVIYHPLYGMNNYVLI